MNILFLFTNRQNKYQLKENMNLVFVDKWPL